MSLVDWVLSGAGEGKGGRQWYCYPAQWWASFQGQSHPLQPADLLMLVSLFTGFLGQLVLPSISAVWKQGFPARTVCTDHYLSVFWRCGCVQPSPSPVYQISTKFAFLKCIQWVMWFDYILPAFYGLIAFHTNQYVDNCLCFSLPYSLSPFVSAFLLLSLSLSTTYSSLFPSLLPYHPISSI